MRLRLLLVLAGCSLAAAHAGAQRAAPPGPAAPTEFRLADFGAKCDGSTDDHAAIQAAFDAADRAEGGVVLWPAAECAASRTVTIGGHADHASFVGLRGVNPVRSVLKWIGPDAGVALRISYNKYFRIEALTVRNAGARGTSVGALLTGPNTTGTQTLEGLFERFYVSGFSTCIQAGEYGGRATSEILWTSVGFEKCNVGWRNGDLNTLDHIFHMVSQGENTIGMDINAGNVYVDGGSSSNNGVDFRITNAGGTYSIRNYRSEVGRRFLEQTGNGQMAITVENCMIVAPASGDRISFDLGLGRTSLALRHNTIDGKVYLRDVGAGASTLEMRGNRVLGDTARPFFVNASAHGAGRLKVSLMDNVFADGDVSRHYDDVPSAEFSGLTFVPAMTVRRDASPTDYLQLNHVRMLAMGSVADGRNLRLQERFAGTGVLQVRFVREVSVTTTTGTAYVDAAPGTFNAGDLGKRLVVTGVDGFHAGGDVIAKIHDVSSDRRVFITAQVPTAIGVSRTGARARIGEAEPDASYFVMLGCNADERIYWTDKTPEGFTLRSSNPASTATCDVLIVR